MLSEEVWLLPHQTGKSVRGAGGCARGYCHVETGKGQTVDTKLEEDSCLTAATKLLQTRATPLFTLADSVRCK